jgi:hypothetical protein
MHTVELLEQALDTARRLGFQVREECVGGNGGGSCVLRGQKSLFLDPTLDISDRLELVCEALQGDPALERLRISAELAALLMQRRAA